MYTKWVTARRNVISKSWSIINCCRQADRFDLFDPHRIMRVLFCDCLQCTEYILLYYASKSLIDQSMSRVFEISAFNLRVAFFLRL